MARLKHLGAQVHKELERQGFTKDRIEIQPFLNMRCAQCSRATERQYLIITLLRTDTTARTRRS